MQSLSTTAPSGRLIRAGTMASRASLSAATPLMRRLDISPAPIAAQIPRPAGGEASQRHRRWNQRYWPGYSRTQSSTIVVII